MMYGCCLESESTNQDLGPSLSFIRRTKKDRKIHVDLHCICTSVLETIEFYQPVHLSNLWKLESLASDNKQYKPIGLVIIENRPTIIFSLMLR